MSTPTQPCPHSMPFANVNAAAPNPVFAGQVWSGTLYPRSEWTCQDCRIERLEARLAQLEAVVLAAVLRPTETESKP